MFNDYIPVIHTAKVKRRGFLDSVWHHRFSLLAVAGIGAFFYMAGWW